MIGSMKQRQLIETGMDFSPHKVKTATKANPLFRQNRRSTAPDKDYQHRSRPLVQDEKTLSKPAPVNTSTKTRDIMHALTPTIVPPP